MTTSEPRKIEGCPFTHLLSASRFAKPSRYIVGPMGVEFSAPTYYELLNSKTFEIKPVFDLKAEPWQSANATRVRNGIWLIHPEDASAGIGLFDRESEARQSVNLIKVKDYRVEIACLGSTFQRFLAPLWDSISRMENSFWLQEGIDHDAHRGAFNSGMEILRQIQHAKQFFALARMRHNHPYW